MTAHSIMKDFRSDSGFSSTGQKPHETELSELSRSKTILWQQYVVELESIQRRVHELAGYVKLVGPLHQRALSSPASVQDELNSTVSKIWSLNWRVRDAIREVELDASRSSDADPFGSMRNKKLGLVIEAKNKFEHELRIYQDEEVDFQERYREHIARQYHLINPEAGEAELRQAANADWSNDRIFGAAVQSSRNPVAQGVLQGVRERYEELKRIDASLRDLSVLFNDLAKTIDPEIEPTGSLPSLDRSITQKSQRAGVGSGAGGVSLTHFDEPARTERAHRRKKRRQLWCLFIVGLIILTILISTGTYFIVHGKYLPEKAEPGASPTASPTSTSSSMSSSIATSTPMSATPTPTGT